MNAAGRVEHLQVLGLSGDAGWPEVQGRYRQLVLAHHPDLHPGDARAAERFRAIAASYSALAALERDSPQDARLCLQRMCRDPRLRALDLEELGQRLQHSSSPWVRAAAAFLLGDAATSPAAPGARRLLRAARLAAQDRVREAAVQSLARIGRPGDLAGYLLHPSCWRGLSPALLLRACAAIWGRALRRPALRLAELVGVSR